MARKIIYSRVTSFGSLQWVTFPDDIPLEWSSQGIRRTNAWPPGTETEMKKDVIDCLLDTRGEK